MTKLSLTILLAVLLAVVSATAQDEVDTPPKVIAELAGDYLGQPAPGLKPTLFAPGIVSTPEHQERDVTFTSDLSEFYFTRDATIMVMKRSEAGWTEPRPVVFSSGHLEFEAFVAPDGQRLYYISQRPEPGETQARFYQIWYVEREGADWGEPKMLTDQRDFYPTMTRDGYMHFTDPNNDLYRSKMVDGSISVREKLSDSINTSSAEYNAFVAIDESYIIFTSFGWGAGFGGGDLFISYQIGDGVWSRAKNMGGGINSNGHDYCPSVSPDGRYLFFSSNRGGTEDLYWVDAGIIDTLRTKDLNTADMLYDCIIRDGSQAGKGKYEVLKTVYDDYCNFDGGLLLAVGDRLIASDMSTEAVDVWRMSADLYPETQSVVQKLKLAVVSGDDALFDEVSGGLKAMKASLTRVTEIQINTLGYRLMGWGKPIEAIRIFRLNVELFPGSFNVYDSYGEALLLNGDTLASIENYERSLELNPENTNAERILNTLRGE